jgi:predicted kinase
MMEQAGDLLDDGMTIILDGTFLRHSWRERARELARVRGVRLITVRCHCPPEIARERIVERLARGNSDSEARPELLDQQMLEEEPDATGAAILEIDTGLALEAQVESVERALQAARERMATSHRPPGI